MEGTRNGEVSLEDTLKDWPVSLMVGRDRIRKILRMLEAESPPGGVSIYSQLVVEWRAAGREVPGLPEAPALRSGGREAE